MLTPAERAVLDDIRLDELLADLAALLQIRSLGGDEDAAQVWMANRLQSLGLDVDRWTIDMAALTAHPSFSMEVPRSSGLGVVGAFGRGEGRTLIFNGHVDVVPIGDVTQWTVDPW